MFFSVLLIWGNGLMSVRMITMTAKYLKVKRGT
jgi:hypothetical protein